MVHKEREASSNRVGIVGLGLIGGSLGLDLQDKDWEVYGLVNRETTAEKAKARGLAHFISTDPKILSDCNLVILALPLDQLITPDLSLIEALPKDAVITDVGSVKSPVLKVWEKIHPLFIASHPMAGTTSAGVDAGLKGLFKGKAWIGTPTKDTNQYALDTVKKVATSLGSQWLISDADTHDQAVALISHLPVIISAALLRTIGQEKNQSVIELSKQLASSGFTDTTRVGGGNPQLGTSMAITNTSELIKGLASFRLSLEELEATITNKNWSKLQEELKHTKSLREKFISD